MELVTVLVVVYVLSVTYYIRKELILFYSYLLNHAEAIRALQEPVAEPVPEAVVPEIAQAPDEPLHGVLPSTGHTLIVGKSGSGKSNVAMLEIITRLRQGHQLYIVDTKQEMGPIFKKHCVSVTDTDGATDMMTQLLKIAKSRRDQFMLTSELLKKPCRDYREYEKLTSTPMPVITLVLEELIVLMGRIGQTELIDLLVVGRSAGVYVFALSQYLKGDILDRKGSVNFGTRVFLGRWDRITISILFGSIRKQRTDEYVAFLGAPGRALVETEGRDLELFTFPRIEDAQLEEMMQ